MDKLRDDDFLYSFLMAPGGFVVWILKRENEIFVQSIASMLRWQIAHFPFVNDNQVTSIIEVLSLLGFQEYPMYGQVNYLKRSNKLYKDLERQFEILDKNQAQAQREADKAQAQTANGPALKVMKEVEK